MSVTIESDIKEILTSINQKMDQLFSEVIQIKIQMTRFEENQKRLEQRLEQSILDSNRRFDEANKRFEQRFDETNKRFEQRFDETNKRIDETNKRIEELNNRFNILFISFLGFVGVLVTGLLGIISKVVFFPNT